MGEELANDDSKSLVTGQILIGSDIPAFENGTAHVRLEDVSYADTRAELIAEAVISSVQHDPSSLKAGQSETVVPFTIRSSSEVSTKIDPQHDYTVRVWVDVNSDGQRGPDDLYSTQQHRVLSRGFRRSVAVPVGPR